MERLEHEGPAWSADLTEVVVRTEHSTSQTALHSATHLLLCKVMVCEELRDICMGCAVFIMTISAGAGRRRRRSCRSWRGSRTRPSPPSSGAATTWTPRRRRSAHQRSQTHDLTCVKATTGCHSDSAAGRIMRWLRSHPGVCRALRSRTFRHPRLLQKRQLVCSPHKASACHLE